MGNQRFQSKYQLSILEEADQAVQTMIVGDSNEQHEATLGKGNAPLGIGVEGNSFIFL